MAGLLTCSLFGRPSQPVLTVSDTENVPEKFYETYSSGSVQVFHLIPY